MDSDERRTTVRIRRATRDDVVEIIRLLADDMLGRERERYETPLPESYYEAFEEIDRDPNQELVVVEDETGVVGTLQLSTVPSLSHRGSRRAIVEAVRVDSRLRGRGIGEEMMRWAMARARERGCTTLQLTTDKQRTDAHRFYERLGFAASHVGMKIRL
jgi:ribosomal protein S18 acetylase RimI-like enzyme